MVLFGNQDLAYKAAIKHLVHLSLRPNSPRHSFHTCCQQKCVDSPLLSEAVQGQYSSQRCEPTHCSPQCYRCHARKINHIHMAFYFIRPLNTIQHMSSESFQFRLKVTFTFHPLGVFRLKTNINHHQASRIMLNNLLHSTLLPKGSIVSGDPNVRPRSTKQLGGKCAQSVQQPVWFLFQK